MSGALSGGDEKHAQSLLSDLARRGQNADDRAKAKLGLAQLEASHGNCSKARILALQVAAVQGIELKTVRRALELAYFEGLTQQEISQRTATPLGTVKSRMRLGLLAMRRTLDGDSQ